jgi:hypothetical protein
MNMEKKTFELEIKELTEEGRFSGYLSTFGNVDAGGDVVEVGAFKKTLRENKAFSFIWSHDSTFHGVIGSLIGKEDAKGLLTEGGFFLEVEDGMQAYKKAKLLQSKGVKLGLSMGYRAVKWSYDTVEGVTVRRLKEVKLREGSITLWPMNEETNLMVKEAGQDDESETKPSKENHVCRKGSGDYVRYRSETRKDNGKTYTVRYGIKKDGKAEEYEYFYPIKEWTAAEARAHCQKHDGSFEVAVKDKQLVFVCKSCGETATLTEPADATQPGADPSKAEPVADHSEKERSLLEPVIEGLEAGKAEPQRLFKQTIDTLEKS